MPSDAPAMTAHRPYFCAKSPGHCCCRRRPARLHPGDVSRAPGDSPALGRPDELVVVMPKRLNPTGGIVRNRLEHGVDV